MLERLIACVSAVPLAYTQSVPVFLQTTLRPYHANRRPYDVNGRENDRKYRRHGPASKGKKNIDGNFNVSSGD